MAASFTEIVALAKDKTPSGRRRLATNFSQAFFANRGNFSVDERALALDILTAVVKDAALEVRRELAGTLSREANVPRSLILTLASDVIEVAQPVLAHSPVLTEPDLLQITQKMGQPHRVAIASRGNLPEKVIEALAASRDQKVSLTLLGNVALRLPETAVRTIAQQAVDSLPIGDALAQRAELPHDVVEQIYWLVGQELREQMRGRFDLNPKLIEKALDETVSRLAQKQSDPTTRRNTAERLVSSNTVTAPFLIELLKARGVDLFREIIQTATKLKPDAATALLSAEGTEAFALTCRAMGFAKTETASLLMLVRDRVGGEAQFNPAMLADALTTFARLTVGDAKTVLWQWQADPSYLLSLCARRN
jgi:uncharacterized protein (DUF2336 family)